MKRTGASIVIESLCRNQVETVFGYPGGAVLPIYDQLYQNAHRIHHVQCAHEQNAAHAADGYVSAENRAWCLPPAIPAPRIWSRGSPMLIWTAFRWLPSPATPPFHCWAGIVFRKWIPSASPRRSSNTTFQSAMSGNFPAYWIRPLRSPFRGVRVRCWWIFPRASRPTSATSRSSPASRYSTPPPRIRPCPGTGNAHCRKKADDLCWRRTCRHHRLLSAYQNGNPGFCPV